MVKSNIPNKLKHTNDQTKSFHNFCHVMKSNCISCFQSKVAKSTVHNLKVRERKEADIFYVQFIYGETSLSSV